MHSSDHALTDHPRPVPASKARGALALGLVGALGEQLLAQLVSGVDYAYVHVAVTSNPGSVAGRLRPWKIGEGVILADDAFIALTGEQTRVPLGSPVARFGPAQLLDAARIARGCGASRLTVIAPLAALLDANAHGPLDAETLRALQPLGFERLLIVWPTAADAQRAARLRGVTGAIRRALSVVTPSGGGRAPAEASAARAIMAAARRMPPGVTLRGTRDLLTLVDARHTVPAPRSA
jgi:hypothetical protein